MMKYHERFVVIGLITVLVISALSPAVAHEEQTVEGYDLTFGGADEPVITDERMWLELEILDNETGEPVADQSETLKISVQKSGGEKVALDVSEKHGDPGVYRVPVVFTEPGDYVIHVEGSIEGTELHAHFEKEVHDRTELEYPGEDDRTDNETGSASNGSQTNDTGDSVQADDTGDQADQAGFVSSFGLAVAAAVIGGVAVIGGGLLYRRR